MFIYFDTCYTAIPGESIGFRSVVKSSYVDEGSYST